jgi:hypothetical protein
MVEQRDKPILLHHLETRAAKRYQGQFTKYPGGTKEALENLARRKKLKTGLP